MGPTHMQVSAYTCMCVCLCACIVACINFMASFVEGGWLSPHQHSHSLTWLLTDIITHRYHCPLMLSPTDIITHCHRHPLSSLPTDIITYSHHCRLTLSPAGIITHWHHYKLTISFILLPSLKSCPLAYIPIDHCQILDDQLAFPSDVGTLSFLQMKNKAKEKVQPFD